MHSASFANNPSNYRPSGKSETEAKRLCTSLATKLGYTVTAGAIDYTKVVNADKLIQELKHLTIMFHKGTFNGLENKIQAISRSLGLTLTKA